MNTASNFDHFAHLSYLVLENHSFCSSKCKFCPREEEVQKGLRPPHRMSMEQHVSLLEQLKNCPIRTVKLHGLSEPMSLPNFDEYAGKVREYFPKAEILTATNLQYNFEKSPFQRALPHLSSLLLSIDGIGDVYETARFGSSWAKAVKVLEGIRTHIPADVRKNKMFVQFTMTAENREELPKIYELNEEYGFGGVRINLAQNWDLSHKSTISHGQDVEKFLAPYKADVKGVPGWQFKDCFWPYEGIYIDAYGDVRHCIMNHTMAPIANVFKSPLEEIYNRNPVFVEAREMMNKNTPPPQCRNCDYFNLAGELEKVLGPAKEKPRAFAYRAHRPSATA